MEGVAPEATEALRPYLPKQRVLLDVVPEDPARIRAPPGIVRMTMVALKLGSTLPVSSLVIEVMLDREVVHQSNSHQIDKRM